MIKYIYILIITTLFGGKNIFCQQNVQNKITVDVGNSKNRHGLLLKRCIDDTLSFCIELENNSKRSVKVFDVSLVDYENKVFWDFSDTIRINKKSNHPININIKTENYFDTIIALKYNYLDFIGNTKSNFVTILFFSYLIDNTNDTITINCENVCSGEFRMLLMGSNLINSIKISKIANQGENSEVKYIFDSIRKIITIEKVDCGMFEIFYDNGMYFEMKVLNIRP